MGNCVEALPLLLSNTFECKICVPLVARGAERAFFRLALRAQRMQETMGEEDRTCCPGTNSHP
jgi:hypothetical protein